MSPWLSFALADARGRELRGAASCPQAREPRRETFRPQVRRSPVRRRVGFALVEAGLHLLATASRN